ncbi:hypothetical protein [Lacrimispora sp.]|uniref:hypothetical protein n=1 Tax=Lacrimispora sp. TaxID=2719234 RepID=UPI0028A776AD|nr:hypothetical protein [Lacrimispora sp.]
MENIKYYEVEMSSKTKVKEMGTYSICIKGLKKPTRKEAEQFIKKDLKSNGYDYVSFVNEIDLEEAKCFYDMENETNFPVFGKLQ